MNLVETIGTAAEVVAGCGAIAFVATYALQRAWRESAIGRNVMALMLLLGAMLTLSIGRKLVHARPDAAWYLWSRLVLMTAGAATVWWRVRIVWRLHRTVPTKSGAHGK